MFFEQLKKACYAKNLSMSALAREIGLSNAIVTKWKNGSVPRPETMKAICNYLGVSQEFLLGKPDDNQPKAIRIPVYGNVSAGIPMEAVTDFDDWEELPPDAKGDFIALRIHGDSMSPRMMNGDVVIVKVQPEVNNGDIAVIMVNGNDATCKKVMMTPDGIHLIPLNPTFAPLFYSNEEIESLPVRILGKVVELRGKF